MAFRITVTEEAETQLNVLSARDRKTIEASILARIRDQPTTPTRAIKQLRANSVAEFELRVGDFLLIVGRKVGNKLVVNGEEFHEHQGHPPESS